MRRASFIPVISWATSVILAASLLWFIVNSVHWPLVGDAALMHYVVFLMDHGRAPYREIGDMNLPGAYLPDWLMVHAFGPSALPWRLYDLVLLTAAGFAILKLVRPVSLHWGFWAAALFALIHGRDGMYQLGQRDLTMAVLLLLGTVALLCLPRSVYACGLFGLGVGMASTIKPTAMLFLLLAGPWLMERQRARKPIAGSLAWILTGFGLPLAVTAGWLMHHDALAAFFRVERTLGSFHASLGRRPLLYLVQHSLAPVLPLAALCLVLAFLVHGKWAKGFATVRGKTLLLGALLGLASYVIQGKGYPYQRYPLLAFLLPLLAMYFGRMHADEGWRQWLATVILVGTSLGVGAMSAVATTSYEWRDPEPQTSLEADLRRFGENSGGKPIGRVQCLDAISGCLDTLNRLGWVQATGTIYDEFLFHTVASPAVAKSRATFWREIHADPPAIFVVTEPLFPDGPGHYAKLDQWPEFASWLLDRYRLAVERPTMRRVHTGGAAYAPPGYRIYVLNGDSTTTILSR